MDCNSNEVGNGDGDKGGKQATATAMATKRVMAIMMAVVGNKESYGNSGKSYGDGGEGGGQANPCSPRSKSLSLNIEYIFSIRASVRPSPYR